MRIAIVSDVHSNLAALDAVLAHADSGGTVDEVWCTGDIVGYGAEPSEVIARLHERNVVAVAGNHDRAACGLLDVNEFNGAAAAAALWTKGVLSEGDRSFLGTLPLTLETRDFTLVHGSLRDPVWEYLLDTGHAERHFGLQKTRFSVVGHSHLQFCFEERDGRAWLTLQANDADCLQLGMRRVILNSGSVGQPRDGDPRAGYILYDQSAGNVTFHRVPYDIKRTQKAMRAAGVDRWLIDRLAVGR